VPEWQGGEQPIERNNLVKVDLLVVET